MLSVSLGRKEHSHSARLHLGGLFYGAVFLNLCRKVVHYADCGLGTSKLSTSETYAYLYFVSFFKEFDSIFNLYLDIVRVNVRR